MGMIMRRKHQEQNNHQSKGNGAKVAHGALEITTGIRAHAEKRAVTETVLPGFDLKTGIKEQHRTMGSSVFSTISYL